jgi:hypothetical protein
VIAAKEYIAAGDIFQAVLSQRFEVGLSAHPFEVYRALRIVNRRLYMFFSKDRWPVDNWRVARDARPRDGAANRISTYRRNKASWGH